MPDTTVFDSLDEGGPPGDGGEVGQDITNAPLPDLDGPEDFNPHHAGDSPGNDEPAEPQPQEQPTARRRRSAEDRIKSLIGQREEARSERDVLAEQMAAMQQQLAQQQQLMLTALQQGRQAPQAPAPQNDPLGFADRSNPFAAAEQQAEAANQPASAPTYNPDIAALVANAVKEQVAPLLETQRSQAQASALIQAHNASFEKAAEDFPELKDPSSTFRQQFNRLYDASPLSGLPNAPEHIALQVRGILADERADNQRQSARKRGAAVHTPSPSLPQEAAATNANALRQQYDQIMARMRAGDRDPRLYVQARKIGMRMKAAQQGAT